MELNKIVKYISSADKEMVELGIKLAILLRYDNLSLLLNTYLKPHLSYYLLSDGNIHIYEAHLMWKDRNSFFIKDPTKILKLKL